METVIVIAQCMSADLPEENIRKAETIIKHCIEFSPDLIVFPEYFMAYYPNLQKPIQKLAQSANGEFMIAMQALAKQYGVWLLFGMHETSENSGEKRCYNTMILLDHHGEQKGRYRKCHLFDAYFWKESKDTIPGETLFSPVKTPFGIVGIGTCYDLRFPYVASQAALKGAQIMIYPSAWVKGKNKYLHWETLLRARAIENQMYVIGCSQYSPDHYMGKSLVISPFGAILRQGEEKEQLIAGTLNLDEVLKARKQVSSLKNRRPDLL